jgi:hypothetical protein
LSKKYLCTLFDINYAHLGLALYASIDKCFQDYHLWILALDNETYAKLSSLNLKNTSVFALREIESPDVLAAKANRTWQEFCWTLSPVLPSFVLQKNPDIEHITYIDSDIFFFSDPSPIFDEIADASVMITPHRFPQRLKYLEENGKYNVQMVFFKNDEIGRACLEKWKAQCLEWCYYVLEETRMGDQKYLDTWPAEFPKVCILKHIGAGVAIWNAEQYQVRSLKGMLYVNEVPLIFYHFHSFKYFSGDIYTSGMAGYNLNQAELKPIYQIYSRLIQATLRRYSLKTKSLSFSRQLDFYATRDLHSVFPICRMINHLVFKLIMLGRNLRVLLFSR